MEASYALLLELDDDYVSEMDAGFGGTPTGEAPQITSPNSFRIIDGYTVIATITATGDPPIVFSLSGGDAALLQIDASSGDFAFIDPAGIGVYTTTISADNVVGTDTLDVTITAAAATAHHGMNPALRLRLLRR